jgi:hypothetical protein
MQSVTCILCAKSGEARHGCLCCGSEFCMEHYYWHLTEICSIYLSVRKKKAFHAIATGEIKPRRWTYLEAYGIPLIKPTRPDGDLDAIIGVYSICFFCDKPCEREYCYRGRIPVGNTIAFSCSNCGVYCLESKCCRRECIAKARSIQSYFLLWAATLVMDMRKLLWIKYVRPVLGFSHAHGIECGCVGCGRRGIATEILLE